MSIFKDAAYEDMDWIAKVAEPLHTPLNDILSQIPEEIEISTVEISQMNVYSRLEVSKMIESHCRSYKTVSYELREKVDKCFQFEVEPNTTIDYRTSPPTVTGGIRLIKIKNAFDDKDISKILGREGASHIRNSRTRDPGFFARANEIAEILECSPETFRTRSPYRKVNFISTRYSELLSSNKWRIRSDELATSVGVWIRSYLEKGDLAAMANICKLKVMTYSDNPIYSIEETK